MSKLAMLITVENQLDSAPPFSFTRVCIHRKLFTLDEELELEKLLMNITPAAIAWMNENKDLAGWAQAFGAFVALGIAILIPAWQQRQQRRNTLLEELKSDFSNSTGVFFLLNDAWIWANDIVGKSGMTRDAARSDFIFDDLCKRILLWEARETNGHRVVALYLTRGALTRTQTKLTWPVMRERMIEPEELALIEKDRNIIREQKEFSKRLHDHALFRLKLQSMRWYRRPLAIFKNRKNIRQWTAPAPGVPGKNGPVTN